MPIPKEESHGKRRKSMGPRGVEIHIDGERTSPPDGESCEESPTFLDILASETKSKKQAQKSIEGSGEGYGDAVRRGETVGSDRGTEGTGEKNTAMGDEEKRHPENGRANSEMVIEMAGGRAKVRPGLIVFVEAGAAETFVGVLIVAGEIETVLDQRGAGKGVIANAVAAYPRIEKWQ